METNNHLKKFKEYHQQAMKQQILLEKTLYEFFKKIQSPNKYLFITETEIHYGHIKISCLNNTINQEYINNYEQKFMETFNLKKIEEVIHTRHNQETTHTYHFHIYTNKEDDEYIEL